MLVYTGVQWRDFFPEIQCLKDNWTTDFTIQAAVIISKFCEEHFIIRSFLCYDYFFHFYFVFQCHRPQRAPGGGSVMDLCKWLLFTCFLTLPSTYTTWKIKIGTSIPMQASSSNIGSCILTVYKYTDAKTGFQKKDICIVINFKCPVLQTSFNK